MSEATPRQIVREHAPSCVHHWVLSDPEAGTVSGRCKRCGGERMFSARAEGFDRFDDDREARQPAEGLPADRAD